MMSTQTNQENIAPKAVNYHFCLFSVVLLVANRLLMITILARKGRIRQNVKTSASYLVMNTLPQYHLLFA